MKLKFILVLSLTALSYIDSFSMFLLGTAGELKRASNQLTPGADNVADALEGVVNRASALAEEAVEILGDQVKVKAREAPKAAIIGIADGVRVAMGAPNQATLPESLTYGTNKFLGTEGAKNLTESANLFNEKVAHPLIETTFDKLVGRLGAPKGSPLPKALEDFETSTKAQWERLKNEIKQSFYTVGKKVLIAGTAIGTVALTYYLIKKYTHPGSLNKNDLNKSKLLVESSGFSNGTIDRLMGLFKSQQPMKKLILDSNAIHKAKDILKNCMLVVRNLKNNKCDLAFKSLFVSGPKGTGKTVFIDNLIKCSNVDYIKINSSSFINFENGEESKAVSAIFNLLKRPKKEIVVVIEQADIILNRPAYKDKLMDLIRWLKTNNKKFMLIVSAEDQKLLGNDILSLMDSYLEFNLPGEQERIRFLSYIVDNLIDENDESCLSEMIPLILDHAKIGEMAKQTDGFSYAQLESMMDQIKTYILRDDHKFTKERIDIAVQNNLDLKAALIS